MQSAGSTRKIASVRVREPCGTATQVDYTRPNGMRCVMSATQYLRDWTMPNFYFHACIGYALLRRGTLNLGKVDFLTFMSRYARPGTE